MCKFRSNLWVDVYSLTRTKVTRANKEYRKGQRIDRRVRWLFCIYLLLQPMLNDQKLTLLPVQKLTDIMTTVHILNRKRTTLYDVPLLQQLHQSRPPKNSMVIVSNFQLQENRELGVFRTECRTTYLLCV